MNVREGCGCSPKRDELVAANRNDGRPKPAFIRRASDWLRWLAPAALLAIMPKCPLCIAAYVALGTGVGVSVATASYIRVLMIGVSLTALAYLAVRQVGRFISTRSTDQASG